MAAPRRRASNPPSSPFRPRLPCSAPAALHARISRRCSAAGSRTTAMRASSLPADSPVARAARAHQAQCHGMRTWRSAPRLRPLWPEAALNLSPGEAAGGGGQSFRLSERTRHPRARADRGHAHPPPWTWRGHQRPPGPRGRASLSAPIIEQFDAKKWRVIIQCFDIFRC